MRQAKVRYNLSKKTSGIAVTLAMCLLAASVNAQQRDPRIGEWREDRTANSVGLYNVFEDLGNGMICEFHVYVANRIDVNGSKHLERPRSSRAELLRNLEHLEGIQSRTVEPLFDEHTAAALRVALPLKFLDAAPAFDQLRPRRRIF